MTTEKKRLGDILIDCNLINGDQLKQALGFQKEKGVKLGQALIDLGLVTEDDIIWALGNQLNISFIHLNQHVVDQSVVKMISPEYAKERRIIPLYTSGNQLSVCMVDPLDSEVVEYIAAKTQLSISVSICTKFDFEQTYSAIYGPIEVQDKVTGEITAEKQQSLEKGIPKGMEAPEKVVNYILGQAIINKVDKIHFEPSEKGVWIRVRTCSALVLKLEIPLKIHQEIIGKLKVLSQIPHGQGALQNVLAGHFRVTVSGRSISVQSLFYPTVNGEMVILKLSYYGENAAEVLGKSKPFLDEVAKFIHNHPGVLYVTGPRESGKTVSIYYLMSSFDIEKTKIVTVENPVQSNIPRVTQIQVGQNGIDSLKGGFDLALQLDADVIYADGVSEPRIADDIAFAGLGGKTVLTTYMSYDSAGSIMKLTELVSDPLVFATSMSGVLSQRLVKILCTECRKPTQLTPEDIQRLRIPEGKGTFFQPGACDSCMQTGYAGKRLVAEFLPNSPSLRQMIINRQNYQEIFHYSRKLGIPSIEEGIIQLVVNGETSIEEYNRLY